MYRAWTQSEYAEAVELRNGGASWGQIAKRFNTSKENARAAYRRAVGAKHGAYLQPVRWHHANPHIAVLDIETLPMVIYAWGLWEEHNTPEQIIQDSCMLSWAGKYLNGAQMFSDILTPEEARARDTSRITKSIWEFLHSADVVIGSRYVADSDYAPSLSRRIGKSLLSRWINLFIGGGITDTTSGFRAMNRAAIAVVAESYPEDYPEPEVLVILHKHGLRAVEIPVTMHPRQGGMTSIRAHGAAYYMVKVGLAILIDQFRHYTPARRAAK